nr:hypothetical protein [Haladaptatus salinisoli]
MLRKRVGIRDAGTVNYHLTKRCEYFVRRIEAGYELDHAGTRVVAAADPTATVDEDDASEAEACPVCGDENCERLFHVHLAPSWA